MPYLTLNDLILLIPMGLAGALFFGTIPARSKMKLNSWRIVGALIGMLGALILVEGLPMLV